MTDTGSPKEIEARLESIKIGMEVDDATGERIGEVADLHLGDPDAIDVGRGDASMPGEGFAIAMGAHREPNVEPGLVNRLLRAGYIKIDDKRHFRRDHHYYAIADDIAAVEEGVVRLAKPVAELILPAG
jgi:hypothetical protein